MDTNHMNRRQTIRATSKAAVEYLESQNCDFTNGLRDDGLVEFSASMQLPDGSTLIAFYYQTKKDVDANEELDGLTWTVDHFTLL